MKISEFSICVSLILKSWQPGEITDEKQLIDAVREKFKKTLPSQVIVDKIELLDLKVRDADLKELITDLDIDPDKIFKNKK